MTDVEKISNNQYAQAIVDFHSIKTDQTNTSIVYLYNKDLNYYECDLGCIKLSKAIVDMLGDEGSKHKVDDILYLIKFKTLEDLSKYNHRNCISLKNGIFDLDTLTFIESDPNQFISFRLDVVYDNSLDNTIWNEYVSSLVRSSDVLKLQEAFGNILTNHYITKKLFYLYGSPNSGKSTFINVNQNFMGKKNFSSLSLKDIEREGYGIANLFGKRSN